jgi:hypothetical protein
MGSGLGVWVSLIRDQIDENMVNCMQDLWKKEAEEWLYYTLKNNK